MTNERTAPVVRWLLAGALLVAALYAGNLAAYHAWAAGGPPTPNRYWHAEWASRFSWLTVALVAAVIAVVWRGIPYRETGSVQNSDLVLLVASIVGVGTASMLNPVLGICGTAHYFLTHAATATVRHMLGMSGGVGRQPVFVALNTAVFAIPAVLLYVRRAQLGGWYRLSLILWTALFLLSYFLAFPTTDCP